MKCGQNESSIIESPREWNKRKECDWMRLAFSNDKERWEPATDRHKLTKGKSYVSTDTVIHDCPRSLLSAEKSARVLFCVCACVCVRERERERECVTEREKKRERVCECYFWVLPLVKSGTAPGLKIASVRMQSYLYSSHTLPASFDASLLVSVCVCVCVCVPLRVCVLILIPSLLCSIALSWVIHSLFLFSSSLLLFISNNHTQTDRHMHAPILMAIVMNEWVTSSEEGSTLSKAQKHIFYR